MARRKYAGLAPSGRRPWTREDEGVLLGWLYLEWRKKGAVRLRREGAPPECLFRYLLQALFHELLRRKRERQAYRPLEAEPPAGDGDPARVLLRTDADHFARRILGPLTPEERRLLAARLRTPASTLPEVCRDIGVPERTGRDQWRTVTTRVGTVAEQEGLDEAEMRPVWRECARLLDGGPGPRMEG